MATALPRLSSFNAPSPAHVSRHSEFKMTHANRQYWAHEPSVGAAVRSARYIGWRFELAILTCTMVLGAVLLAIWPH
jgi:hypothetical protein